MQPEVPETDGSAVRGSVSSDPDRGTEADQSLGAILDLVGELDRQLVEVKEANQSLREELGAKRVQESPESGFSDLYKERVRKECALGLGAERLFSALDTCRRQVRTGTAAPDLFATLNALVKYADEHYTCEQKILDEIDHPGRLENRKDHEQFLECLFLFASQLQKCEKRGRVVLAEKLLSFLTDWTSNHLLGA